MFIICKGAMIIMLIWALTFSFATTSASSASRASASATPTTTARRFCRGFLGPRLFSWAVYCNTNRQLQLQSAQDTHSTLSTIAFTDIQSLYRYLLLVIVSPILYGTTHYCPQRGTLHIPLYDTLVTTSPSRPCNMFVMLLFSCNQLTNRTVPLRSVFLVLFPLD